MRFLYLLMALGAPMFASQAHAQCCGGRCTVPAVAVASAAPSWQWRANPGAEWLGLFRDGTQVGAWSAASGYRPLLPGDAWGEACEPPVALPAFAVTAVPSCRCCRDCPCGRRCACYRQGACAAACNCARRDEAQAPEGCTVEDDGTLNFGVRQATSSDGPPRYWVAGKPAARQEVLALLGAGGKVPDDAGQCHLTVIGTEDQRRPVLHDIDAAPALAPWKGRLKVQSYDPTHWAVARSGFFVAGAPTIYYQAPDGRVLHRQDDYAGGAEALAGALRRADPSYQPQSDPDRRRSDPSGPASLPWSAPAAAVGALVLLLLSRRSS